MTRRLLLCLSLCLGCDAVQGDLLRTVPVPDLQMPVTPECTSGVLGAATLCVGEGDLKARASTLCLGDGRALTALTPYEQCGASQYRFAKYQCCPTTSQGACTSEIQGGETSCKGEREWAAAARESCALSKGVPSGYSFLRLCSDMGNLFRYVRYLCCPPVTITAR